MNLVGRGDGYGIVTWIAIVTVAVCVAFIFYDVLKP